jgi:hypothetical protein
MNGGQAGDHPDEDVIIITGTEETTISEPLMLLGSVGKSGYLLDEYYYDADFSGDIVNPTDQLLVGEELVIYAKWDERIDFTVELGDGIVFGSEPPVSTMATFARKGSRFDESIVYEHGDSMFIKDGFHIEGYYFDDALTQAVSPAAEIGTNWIGIPIYIKWAANL